MDDVANRLVDAVLRDFPDHVPGTRPVHSRGVGAQGFFQPSEIAADYCRAELFARRVKVTTRFSTATGSPAQLDCEPAVRGMAVKFHLADQDVDLIAISAPMFPCRTVDEFFAFAAAAQPMPVRRRSILGTVSDALSGRKPPPEPLKATSPLPGLYWFGVTHPAVMPATLAMSVSVTPVGYARLAYHAIHAFRLTGGDGSSRWVRFHWDPVAGVRPLSDEGSVLAPNYLQTELTERLAEGPVEFSLRVQVADLGDDPSDPSRPWPWRRRLVDMGRLVITAPLDADATERLSYNPTRLTDGIAGCDDDKILEARGLAYEASWARRSERTCPAL
jgi:catalase